MCTYGVAVPFVPGRTNAVQEQTDIASFSVLEPVVDGFRNYVGAHNAIPAKQSLIERAQLLGLTAREMTVLVGGLRVLGANFANSPHGVLTGRPGELTNEFFVNLLDMSTVWEAIPGQRNVYEGRDRGTGNLRWSATRVDLVFGSNSQLRALAEVYGERDAQEQFVTDFVEAWNKVTNADRFDRTVRA